MIQIINAWDGDVGIQWIKSLWELRHAPNPWARVKEQGTNGSHTHAPYGNGMGNAMVARANEA
eukprot:7967276-Karenia_brevis.AAC.1